MHKFRALLSLLLTLLLPCALADTPQGLDLSLVSNGALAFGLKAASGDTPFCSLTLPSGQVDVVLSPDKGLCVGTNGQWQQVLVEGHPLNATLQDTPLSLLGGHTPAESTALLQEDLATITTHLSSLFSGDTIVYEMMKRPAMGRVLSDLFLAAQTGTVSLTSDALYKLLYSLLDEVHYPAFLSDLHFGDAYQTLVLSLLGTLSNNLLYFPPFSLFGQANEKEGNLRFSLDTHRYSEEYQYQLTYEQTAADTWRYVLTDLKNFGTIEGTLYYQQSGSTSFSFVLNGFSTIDQKAFSILCEQSGPQELMLTASIDDSYQLSIVEHGSDFSFRLEKAYAKIFALDITDERIHAELVSPALFYLIPADSTEFVMDITPAENGDGLDIIVTNPLWSGIGSTTLLTAALRATPNGLTCTGEYNETPYTLTMAAAQNALTFTFEQNAQTVSLALTLTDTSAALVFTDALGQRTTLSGSLCSPEAPVLPDTMGTIELAALLSQIF